MSNNDEHWKMGDSDGAGEGGEATEQSYVEPGKKMSLSKGMLGVIITFGVGVAAIWAIGKQTGPAPISAHPVDDHVEQTIRAMLDKTGNGQDASQVLKDTDKMLAMFYNYPGAPAAPLEELPVNPFEHVGVAPPPMPGEPVSQINTSAEDAEKLRRLADAYKALKLQTVLLSKKSSFAMINNKLLAVGNHIGEFLVSEIQSDRVVLTGGGRSFELKLVRPGDDAQ